MAEESEDNYSSFNGNVEPQQQPNQPVYTSYKTSDLNGGSKPPLVRVSEALKPFTHTIPVDKISPANEDVNAGVVEVVDPDKIEKPPVIPMKNQGMIPNLERIVEIETFVKDASEEPGASTSVPPTEMLIDDEKVLKMTTTEAMAEIIHPDFNNGEKLVLAEEPIIYPSRNLTFIKVSYITNFIY